MTNAADQFLESKEGGGILAPGPGKHFGECEDAIAEHRRIEV